MSCVEVRNITVHARRDPTSTSGFKFSMSENGSPVSQETINAQKNNSHKQSDYHTFVFALENAADTDLRFVDNPFDVMWVAPGNASQAPNCPDRRSNDRDFNVGEIGPHRLVVHNANSRQCKHKFVLNFFGTKADGKQGVVPYDPIWGNGNGGS